MPIQRRLLGAPIFILLLLPRLPFAFGYGSAGPIAAAFGEEGFFCAIDASGKQDIICWDKENKSSSSAAYFNSLPAMVSLSGGEGFMCGITSNASKAYCWNLEANSGADLVPEAYQGAYYLQMAAGKDHVCGIRGEYFSKTEVGSVDCWQYSQEMGTSSNVNIVSNSMFRDRSIDGLVFRTIVSGEGFSCGVVKDGGVICWGPKSGKLRLSPGDLKSLAAGTQSVCGIATLNGEVKCWGEAAEFGSPPVGTRFISLSVGAKHYCGIREDDHTVECWGNIDSSSSVPMGSGFMAIASSDSTTCGVREVDLVLDCWGVHGQSPPDYSPPLQLCSPGVCSLGSCASGTFAFNASGVLNEPGLTSLCARKDLQICLPCGTNCSEGYFPSSVCTENADRVCTACSLCQNRSCLDICKISSSSLSGIRDQERQEFIRKLVIIIGSLVSGSLLILICWFIFTRIIGTKNQEKGRSCCNFCAGKQVVEADSETNSQTSLSVSTCNATTQLFRLSELKDATHGFKEYNELGRGNFGFVYKAVLTDGSQVAVKRANAATIIHTNTKEFEAELEILCKIRHGNIVNLLGYCAEMGERLLVYEYMPHGTLHDHLHGELSPLDWNLRLKISLQAARGLEYLHKQAKPPIVHRNVRTSNILLDAEWGARISDFGLLLSTASDKDQHGDMESDVYDFGIVLLEILSGRKAYDRDCSPPGIVEWALPVIRRGKAAAIVDKNVALPRNVEPLLKLAEIADLALRENPGQQPSISELVCLLDQTVKSGMTM
ncbi:Mitogen-activated protein kinase kinase kinase [Parasponia andersonii]|uniref:non-specific serine/threonine protein kinase n=1 Tax=Parasponia andersonii TaxID=3476 RepID=A0A2P5ABE6_PARAD|nr:Mitogen-activated protein kinase kinase kinase [Parasponia andersonii]